MEFPYKELHGIFVKELLIIIYQNLQHQADNPRVEFLIRLKNIF